MEHLFGLLFDPPDVAEGLLGGGLNAIRQAVRLVYYRGVMDGFLAGCVFAMLMTLRGGRRCDREP